MWFGLYLLVFILIWCATLLREKLLEKKLEKMTYNDSGYWDLKKKKDDVGIAIGAWVVFGAPVCMLFEVALEGAGAGAFAILLIFFVICGLGGWVSSGATNSAPPPPPQPPTYVEKNWQHSPEGIETQKFEGGYDGSLNKDFENK